jgi:hypothetical protein
LNKPNAHSWRDGFLITTAGWVADPVGKHAWLDALREQMTLTNVDLTVIATREYGDPATTLAQLVGHADPGFTMKAYARDAREPAAVAKDVLARAAGSGVGL